MSCKTAEALAYARLQFEEACLRLSVAPWGMGPYWRSEVSKWNQMVKQLTEKQEAARDG